MHHRGHRNDTSGASVPETTLDDTRILFCFMVSTTDRTHTHTHTRAARGSASINTRSHYVYHVPMSALHGDIVDTYTLLLLYVRYIQLSLSISYYPSSSRDDVPHRPCDIIMIYARVRDSFIYVRRRSRVRVYNAPAAPAVRRAPLDYYFSESTSARLLLFLLAGPPPASPPRGRKRSGPRKTFRPIIPH